jgi:hypothetical protein
MTMILRVSREPAAHTRAPRLVQQTVSGDVATRKAIVALTKTAMRHADRGLRPAVGRRLLHLADAIDLVTTGDGLGFVKEIFGRIVEDNQITLQELVRRAWPCAPANQILIVRVILGDDREGTNSPLLADMLSWPLSDEVRRVIWKSRM